jgi:hypothetical protein
MRVHDADARLQGLRERGQPVLDEGLRRRIALAVGVARDDLGALGLDTVADDDLADTSGRA